METALPLCKILLEREQGDLLTAQSGIGRRLKSGCGGVCDQCRSRVS